jgi:hypothetical protein
MIFVGKANALKPETLNAQDLAIRQVLFQGLFYSNNIESGRLGLCLQFITAVGGQHQVFFGYDQHTGRFVELGVFAGVPAQIIAVLLDDTIRASNSFSASACLIAAMRF